MQPLAYQIGTATCWATSIINGIMFLGDGSRIESFQYKILHSVLNSILRRRGVGYYEDDDFMDYQDVTNVLETYFSLRFHCVRGADVEQEICSSNFKGEVAVCDVGNGDHSILLNGKSKCGEWLSAFDPYWYRRTENDRIANENVQFPDEVAVNVRIRLHHLLEHPYGDHADSYRVGKAYPMGQNVPVRFLTVIGSSA